MLKAEADPWKVIVAFIIIIVCTILILLLFTDKFTSSSKNLKFECWELEIPGRCFCPNPADCSTQEGREDCLKNMRAECYGK
jgi:hypothetical protein